MKLYILGMDKIERHFGDSKKVGNKRWRDKLKLEVFIHYGGDPPRCACCGESNYLFLTIDHIHGGGTEHRKKREIRRSAGLYSWLKQNDYPEGYQILCWNCNCGKRMNNGICPHKSDI